MELLILIVLYYLSQNPDFERSVKPLLGELKNSQQALNFLEELSQFSKMFSLFNAGKGGGMSASKASGAPPKQEHAAPEKDPQPQAQVSPTAGIADGFIEDLIEKYFHPQK